ncbi:hypothetical protein [Psychromonas arctica]|uniref:hypothetical protein n=1 Tax=Psychromonas arctica TaxID=168275 RepID=UPI00048F7BA4|nr:hypothetical protein [Psychromonas arctica]
MKQLIYVFFLSFLLQGCAGERHSYTELVESDNGISVIKLHQDEVKEVLAIGDGFPGRWGYYPSVISSSPDVASISCEASRSLIPFREPGMIFGGEICKITAHKKGQTTLYFGNRYPLNEKNYHDKVDVIVNEK